MQTKKMSLVNIQGKLSRAEMKEIMAGSTWVCTISCGGNETYIQACNSPCMVTNNIIYCDGRMYYC